MKRTSRKIASRTSRPLAANGRRTRVQILKVTGPINEQIGRLKERKRDRMYELLKAERFDDWDREKVEFDRKIQALEDKLGPLDHEYWAAKKNPRLRANGEPEWLESFTLGPGRSVILYQHDDGRVEARIFMHGGDVFELLRTDFFDTVEQARAAAPQLSMPSRRPSPMVSNRMRRNPVKPSDKRLLKMLEEKCGPAGEWHGRCTEISRAASELVGHPDVYGHYRGPVHEGGYWGERKGHPFIQHGWVKLPAGKVLDPTRFSFEHRDPYIHVGRERPEYDEGGQIWRAQMQAQRPPPKRGDGPVRRFTYWTGPEAARAIAMIFGPDEVDLHDVNGSVTLSLYQAFYLANMPYEALHPYTHAIYEAIDRAGNRAHIPLDNWRRAKREETR